MTTEQRPPRQALGAAPPGDTTSVVGPSRKRRGLGSPAEPSSTTATTVAGSGEVTDLRPRRARRLAVAAAVAVVLVAVGVCAVFVVRWWMSLDTGQQFLRDYPGSYDLPEGSASGFPLWVQWQHFLNGFLMVLIIRSGLRVRRERRPDAYWTPRWARRESSKISLTLWFHQSLDVLWLVNGVIFVVALWGSGHWVRIVPTQWEVFPNAISAFLQYVSLSWPTESGWSNYNSLQQLAYFTTVFIAAPVAGATGWRMSGLWPNRATRLSRVFPVEWARALHFPVMLYFVAFIAFHVALVFATGALRNLNHMFGNSDEINWTGFAIFAAATAVTIAAWFAARPVVLASVARLTGKVTAR